MAARRNDDGSALSLDFLAQAVGIIGLIGKDLLGLQTFDLNRPGIAGGPNS